MNVCMYVCMGVCVCERMRLCPYCMYVLQKAPVCVRVSVRVRVRVWNAY